MFNEITGLFDEVEEIQSKASSLNILRGNDFSLLVEYFVLFWAFFILGYLCTFSILLVIGIAVNVMVHIIISLLFTVILLFKIRYYDKV